jgi:Mg2+/Co2+ transporter CorB
MTLTWITILLLLVCSAVFSCAETSITAVSRPRMHALQQEGDRRAAVINRLRARMEPVIGAILLGNNLVNILASALATGAMIALFGEEGVALAAIGMTVLVVMFGEVLPKTYAINNADRTALALAPSLDVMVKVFSPVTHLMQAIVRFILRLFGLKTTAELGSEWAEQELRGAIDLHAEHASKEGEAGQMLHSILDLRDVPVSDIMVHRSNVLSVNADLSPAEIVEQVLASPNTRIPLWRNESEHIVGVLHVKALLRAIQANRGGIDGLDIMSLAAPAWFIPETTSLTAQLQAFRHRREHFALVVDEYGALMGIVTLEDILEEIVGEIEDEHDVSVRGVEREADGGYRVDGLVTIRDLNREFGWRLPDEEASTVAGLVLHEARRIPDKGQVFVFHGMRFEILERQRNQITALRIKPLATDGADEAALPAAT